MVGDEVRLVAAHEDLADQGLDGRQLLHFIGAHQGHRLALVAGAAGPADAVDIVFRHDGQVQVDHQRQVLDVQATGGHVGRDQDVGLAGLEAGEGTQSRGLGLVAMDGFRRQPLGLQRLYQLLHTLAGLGEHQHLAMATAAIEVQEEFGLALLVDRHHPLLDGDRGGVARTDVDSLGVAQHRGGQLTHGVGEGRREQQGLALARQHDEQLAQLPGKAQVEHAIGFVQHQQLYLVEAHGVLVEQVEQAPGGRHQHVHALAQLHHLRIDAHATVGHGGTQGQVLGIVAQTGMDLLGQLAGGGEDQGANMVWRHRRAFLHQSLQERQSKGAGLAGAGLGGGQQVATGQHRRDGLALDGRGGAVLQGGERLQQRIYEAEVGKGHDRPGWRRKGSEF